MGWYHVAEPIYILKEIYIYSKRNTLPSTQTVTTVPSSKRGLGPEVKCEEKISEKRLAH